MPKRPSFRSNPEEKIQNAFVEFVKLRGWHVERMTGNAFQKGIPDLYLFHKDHGHRWVDVKNPQRNTLTKDQCRKWPVWKRVGIDIHIITGATEEEYTKLFGPANWEEFWRPAYDKYIIPHSDIIDSIFEGVYKPPE